MQTLPVTAALAAAAAVGLVALSLPVALRRGKLKLSAGDGGDAAFNSLIRAQANFTEYTPIGLIVVGLLEMCGFHGLALWSVAGLLAAGRLSHAIGMIGGIIPARAAGAIMTFLSLLLGGGILVGSLLA